MARKMSKIAEGGDAEVNSRPRPGVINIEEHAEPVEDVYDWVSTKFCQIHPKLKLNKPVTYYQKYLIPPTEQSWRLVSVPGVPACSSHNNLGFFFYGVAWR